MSDMITFLKPDFEFDDDRGWLRQLCHEGWTQVNLSYTKKNIFRGGHLHRENREAFYIIQGKIDITLEKDGKTENLIVTENSFFAIEKGVKHTFKHLEETLMLAMYDKGVENENGQRDIWTE